MGRRIISHFARSHKDKLAARLLKRRRRNQVKGYPKVRAFEAKMNAGDLTVTILRSKGCQKIGEKPAQRLGWGL